MKYILFGLASLIVLGFLTGCGEEAKTKEYYSQHIDEAKLKREACKKLEKANEIQRLDCENAGLALASQRSSDNYGKSVDTSFLSTLPGEKQAENPYNQK